MSKNLFEDDIRPLRSKIRDVELPQKAKAAYRDSQRLKQVVVKVSSYGKSTRGVNAHIDYISRKNDLALEDSSGNILNSKDEVRELMSDWFSKSETRKNARLTVNIVLSAPIGSNREAVRKATRDFAKKTFSANHDYLFAMHNDTAHPHAHLAVKLRGYDGTKLRLGKKELFELRQGYAESLRKYGIAATASYRSDRGIGKKPTKQPLKHMRERGMMPETDKQAVREAADDLKGKNRKSRPWVSAMKRRNEETRQSYRDMGKLLESSEDEATQAIGRSISDYAEKLPSPMTRHEELKEAIRRKITERRQEIDRGPGTER